MFMCTPAVARIHVHVRYDKFLREGAGGCRGARF